MGHRNPGAGHGTCLCNTDTRAGHETHLRDTGAWGVPQRALPVRVGKRALSVIQSTLAIPA